MSSGKRRPKILDGEALFNHYFIDMGSGRSYNKLVKWAADKWGKNPENGKIWTTGAVWQAAWRFAFRNLEYAKKIYASMLLEQGMLLTDEEWNTTLARHAKITMTKNQFRRFMNNHPEVQEYEEI